MFYLEIVSAVQCSSNDVFVSLYQLTINVITACCVNLDFDQSGLYFAFAMNIACTCCTDENVGLVGSSLR